MKQVKRIFDLLARFQENPDTIGKFFLSQKVDKQWVKYNVYDYIRFSNKVSSALLEKGILPGDKVATITNNRPQWNFVDMGILQIGGVHVTIYPTISNEEFEFILKHSDTKILFIANKILYKKIKPIADKINTITDIYTFEEVEGAQSWNEFIKIGEDSLEKNFDKIEELKSKVTENDLANIIYTSGTTGNPKGVMLSHKNILSIAIESSRYIPLNYNDTTLSFLPLAHIFAHMTNYMYQYLGISIYYAENITKIAENIHDLNINGFITVPRLLEAIYDKIVSKAKKLPKAKQKIFEHAIKIAEQYEPYTKKSAFYEAQLALMKKLVFSQWQKALNPNIKFIGCGGSALSPRLSKIFWAAGFPVFEGYGLTETSPIIAVNRNEPGKIKIGTVGPLLDNVQVKFGEEGEILVKSPGVMLGYYKDPEKTKEVFTDDGWFKTGDIGELDEDGFLKITDRKKEIFKLSSGKYIAPQHLENKLKESFLIKQAAIVGENQKFPAALIAPNFEFLEENLDKDEQKSSKKEDWLNLPKVIKLVQDEIKKINKSLGEHEKIRKFKLIPNEFTIEKGELSNSLKLKRKVIQEKYKNTIDEIFGSSKQKNKK